MSDKQKSYKQKCHDIVGSIGGVIVEDTNLIPLGERSLRLFAPSGFTLDPKAHVNVYVIDMKDGGKTGAWKRLHQDLRYYLNNGYYTCEAKQPGSLDKSCCACDQGVISI
jgi:hypothetical protein